MGTKDSWTAGHGQLCNVRTEDPARATAVSILASIIKLNVTSTPRCRDSLQGLRQAGEPRLSRGKSAMAGLIHRRAWLWSMVAPVY